LPWECNSMKTGSKTILGLVGAVIVCGSLHAADSWTVVAALKGTDVLLVDHASGNVTKLTGDPRGKWALRWLPDGQRISYLVFSETKEFPNFVMSAWPKLVISDLTGKATREIPLRPPGNSSNPESIRAIEEVKWLSNRLVRFEGSFGPRNCAVFDLDLDTSKTLREWDLECDTLVASPDEKHVAYLGPVSMGSWDDRVHRVYIDDGAASYAGVRGAPIHMEAGPVWSEDSQRVAVLERQIQSGQMAVTTVSIRGEVVTVPVPSDTKDNPSLTWIANRVAVGSGGSALVVDPISNAYSLPLDRDSSAILEGVAQAGRKARDAERSVSDVQARLGAREAVARPDGEPGR